MIVSSCTFHSRNPGTQLGDILIRRGVNPGILPNPSGSGSLLLVPCRHTGLVVYVFSCHAHIYSHVVYYIDPSEAGGQTRADLGPFLDPLDLPDRPAETIAECALT